MKNGIAMISNFSMPVNSFSATDSIGTVGHREQEVSTVRPSEIEIGMPVSISAEQQREDDPRVGERNAGELQRDRNADDQDRQQRRPARRVRGHDRRDDAHRGLPVAAPGAGRRHRRRSTSLDALDVRDVVVRQLAGARRTCQATCRKRKHIRYEPSGMHR